MNTKTLSVVAGLFGIGLLAGCAAPLEQDRTEESASAISVRAPTTQCTLNVTVVDGKYKGSELTKLEDRAKDYLYVEAGVWGPTGGVSSQYNNLAKGSTATWKASDGYLVDNSGWQTNTQLYIRLIWSTNLGWGGQTYNFKPATQKDHTGSIDIGWGEDTKLTLSFAWDGCGAATAVGDATRTE